MNGLKANLAFETLEELRDDLVRKMVIQQHLNVLEGLARKVEVYNLEDLEQGWIEVLAIVKGRLGGTSWDLD